MHRRQLGRAAGRTGRRHRGRRAGPDRSEDSRWLIRNASSSFTCRSRRAPRYAVPFRNQFPDSAIYPNRTDGPDKRLSVISLRHLLERWGARLGDEIRLVAGHFPLSTIEVLEAAVRHADGAPAPGRTHVVVPASPTRDQPGRRREVARGDLRRPLPVQRCWIRNHMTRMLSLTREELIVGDGVLGDVEDTPKRLERCW